MSAGRKKDDPWMTLNRAGKELGESRYKVLTRTTLGELEAKHEAGRTLVSRASVERVRRQKAAAAA